MDPNASTPPENGAPVPRHPFTNLDRPGAQLAIAATSVVGVSAGAVVGIIVGMKMHSGAARMHHRLAAVHEAWDTLRN